ncbi:amino acid ABC transporter permease [Roseomonas populi]|uniref:Amino acid ABC transporter permease n=1 Tax=Roseomonas populi TaxID=3121582 RepID=A0ABT1X3C4_9PROT|nr:amino acid ABC transporter permease [Roseomonas pecuniae]MCR0982604.1 amino acid ABC transporter permease [Roseomonas pecuniae]
MQELIDNFANLDSLIDVYPLLLQGLWLTLLLAAVALPTALAGGLTVALLYSFGGKVTRRLLIVLIDFLRAFPVLVLLVLVFYGLPFLGIRLGSFAAVVLALGLNNTGYFGEIFRAGLASIPRGQAEAATALGLSRFQVLVLVLLPQAVRKVMAPLAGNALELVKTTSIGALVAMPELLRSARVAQEQTYNPTPLMAAALIYFVLLWPFSHWVAVLERRAIARH